jgi:hypothetical protein
MEAFEGSLESGSNREFLAIGASNQIGPKLTNPVPDTILSTVQCRGRRAGAIGLLYCTFVQYGLRSTYVRTYDSDSPSYPSGLMDEF